MPRSTRTTSKPKVLIQPRDVQIFKLLYDFRMLTADAVAQLAGPVEEKVAKDEYQFRDGRESIIKRLKLLSAADYINTIKKPGQKYIYTLGRKAADILAQQEGIPLEELNKSLDLQRRSERYFDHALMVSEFHTMLALAVQQRPNLKLLTWLNASEQLDTKVTIPPAMLTEATRKWKTQDQINLELPISPDAVFGLQDEKGKFYFMFEADRATMPNKRFLQKMTAYYYFWALDQCNEWSVKAGIDPEGKAIEHFRVITYTTSPKRQENLVNAARQAIPEGEELEMFWFTNQAFLVQDKPGRIFEQIFSIAKELNSFHSILK
jgi:hypothetical protein